MPTHIKKPIPTYWCPKCKNTSVADENEDGSITCYLCQEMSGGASAEINGIRDDLRGIMSLIQSDGKL